MRLTAIQELAEQWVDDGKATLIEQDDPSWWAAVKAVSLKKHYGPGPHPSGTSQDVHGRGGGGGRGPSAGRPTSPYTAEHFNDWAGFIRSDLTEDGIVYLMDTHRARVCSKCGHPAWEIPPNERGRYGNPPGEKYTHIGSAYGPVSPEGGQDQLNLMQADETGETYVEPFEGDRGTVYTKVINHRPPGLVWNPDEVDAYHAALEAQRTEAYKLIREEKKFQQVQAEAEAKRQLAAEEAEFKADTKARLVDPLIAKGKEVMPEIQAELEKAEAINEERRQLVRQLNEERRPLNAQAIKGRSELNSTIRQVAMFEASRYPGVDRDEVYRFLQSEEMGATVRERLDKFRERATGEGGTSEPLRIKGTPFQYGVLEDAVDSGSESANEVADLGVTFDAKSKQWVIPDQKAGMAFRGWVDDRHYYAWNTGEKRSFGGLLKKVSTGMLSHPFIGEGQAHAKETYWAISGPRSESAHAPGDGIIASPDDLIQNTWLETAHWDTEAVYSSKVFDSGYPTWDGSYISKFMGTEPIGEVDARNRVYSSAGIVDSLLVQAEYFEIREATAQAAVDASRAQVDQLYVEQRRSHVDAVNSVLSRYRDFGGETVEMKGHTGRAIGVRELSRLYPTTWVEQANASSKPVGIGTKVRADYSPSKTELRLPPEKRFGTVYLEGTIIHELGHHFETHVDSVQKAEKAFYEYRTAGEPSVRLNSITSGYKPYERTKPDGFSDPYMGRDYGSGGYGGYELISMGAPRVYGYLQSGMSKGWQDPDKPFDMDPEMAHFIIGLLAEG